MKGTLITGRDGKTYPDPSQRQPGELRRIIALEHDYVCRQGLSRPETRRRLLAEHEIRRSLGSISQDVSRYTCRYCDPDRPTPVVLPRVVHWQ